MHASHHTLSLLAADLQEQLRENTISSMFTQERNELCISFEERPGCLFVSCAPDLPVLFLHDSFARAKRNSADILPGAVGDRVTGVRLHPSDRVLNLDLATGRCLEVRLFGPHANVFLLDSGRTVLDAFKQSRRHTGTILVRTDPSPSLPLGESIRKLAHAARSVPGTGVDPARPDASGHGPAIVAATDQVRAGESLSPEGQTAGHRGKPEERQRATRKSVPTLSAALKDELPVLSPVMLRELLHRAGLPSGVLPDGMSEAQWSSLDAAAQAIERELAAPRYALVSTAEGRLLHFSTVRLTHLPGMHEEVYPGIHTALREFFTRKRTTEALQKELHRLRTLLRRRVEKVERICEAIRTDSAETDRAAAYRRYGSLLMEHLDVLPKGASTWTAPGVDGPVPIPLVPSLSGVQNAQRYFEKAKSAERSRVMAAERLRAYTSVLARLHDLRAGLDAVTTRSALRTFMKQQEKSLRSLGAFDSPEDQERAPFRVFTVHGGFEVWAGKSSANNDDLTLHHARPDDLWFHARGASGSHVILKVSSAAGEPGKRTRAEAAGIAAYYSKMRNARVVPVAMTRRKYVHKPKGAPPGTVVITREEVVMATPALPQEHSHKTGDPHADA